MDGKQVKIRRSTLRSSPFIHPLQFPQYIAYPFKDGVSVGCPASEPHCFCRINSISRGQFCTWRAHTSDETEDKCRSRLGYAQGNTDAWYNECLANHASAWHSEYNDHFAAKLFAALKVCRPLVRSIPIRTQRNIEWSTQRRLLPLHSNQSHAFLTRRMAAFPSKALPATLNMRCTASLDFPLPT